jgi:hypothetical protein
VDVCDGCVYVSGELGPSLSSGLDQTQGRLRVRLDR